MEDKGVCTFTNAQSSNSRNLELVTWTRYARRIKKEKTKNFMQCQVIYLGQLNIYDQFILLFVPIVIFFCGIVWLHLCSLLSFFSTFYGFDQMFFGSSQVRSQNY